MGRDVTGLRVDQKPSKLKDVKSSSLFPMGQKEKAVPARSDVDAEYDSVDERLNQKPTYETAAKSNALLDDGIQKDIENLKYVEGEVAIEDDEQDALPAKNTNNNELEKKILSTTDVASTKQQQLHDGKRACAVEDNWSLGSSSSPSLRTNKSKLTVPVAPRFIIEDRLERRKEFYDKLEEKHKALEKEKLAHEARIKEEEAATIKQLRKSMVYKANPVPSFYREGPKTEIKKLPVTRAKSPKLSRRKSFGDAAKNSTSDDKEGKMNDRVGACKSNEDDAQQSSKQ